MKYYVFSMAHNKYLEVEASAFFDYVRDFKCDSLTYSFNTMFFCVPDEDLPSGIAKKIMAFCIDINKPFK